MGLESLKCNWIETATISASVKQNQFHRSYRIDIAEALLMRTHVFVEN